jgi:Domain of unknown function (DUF4149)
MIHRPVQLLLLFVLLALAPRGGHSLQPTQKTPSLLLTKAAAILRGPVITTTAAKPARSISPLWSPATSNNRIMKSSSSSRLQSTTAGSSGNEKKKDEEWTKARLHNTNAFRSAAILGAVAAAGLATKSPLNLLSAQGTALLHLLSFSTWFGTTVYTTFILGITMFKNLPRKTFGTLQSKLFPKYFALSSVAIVLQVRCFRMNGSPEKYVAFHRSPTLTVVFFTKCE